MLKEESKITDGYNKQKQQKLFLKQNKQKLRRRLTRERVCNKEQSTAT